MSRVHQSPEEAVQAHRILGAGTSLATRFGTLRLADDGEFEAPARVATAMAHSPGDAKSSRAPGFGEGREVPPAAR